MISKRYVPSLLALLGAGLVIKTHSIARADDWLVDPISGCKIWTDQADSLREVVTWSGPCVDGKASGEGVLVWFKDDGILGRYVGSMRAGKLHGHGVLHYRPLDTIEAMKVDVGDKTLDDGRIVYHYEGTLRAGELEGRGILYYRSDRGYDRYEGEFRDGEIDGKVVFEGAQGDRFEGRTRGLEGTGEGVYVAANGERYEGPFVKGQPSGRGRYTAPNGDMYEANFVDGKAHGKVSVTRADGRREEFRREHGRPVDEGDMK